MRRPSEQGARIAKAISIWQPRSTHPLTEEDVRQIETNLTGFFKVLMEWHAGDTTGAGTEATVASGRNTP